MASIVELNNKAKEYLREIKEEYQDSLSEEKQTYIDELIQKDIILDSNILEKIITSREDIEGLIINQLFHYLINPSPSVKYNDAELTNFITLGLVDIYAIGFMKEREIGLEYYSNYYNNVLFMKDRLSFLPDKESQDRLVFMGNIDQIIENTSNSPEGFMKEYREAKEHQTEYELLIRSIASHFPIKDREESYFRSIMRLSVRTGKEEAISIIKKSIMELDPNNIDNRTPEEIIAFQRETIDTINSYLNRKVDTYK